jgi:hypothetical protein
LAPISITLGVSLSGAGLRNLACRTVPVPSNVLLNVCACVYIQNTNNKLRSRQSFQLLETTTFQPKPVIFNQLGFYFIYFLAVLIAIRVAIYIAGLTADSYVVL